MLLSFIASNDGIDLLLSYTNVQLLQLSKRGSGNYSMFKMCNFKIVSRIKLPSDQF